MHARAVRGQHGERDVAGALVLPFAVEPGHAPRRDQAAEAPIGRAVSRKGKEMQPLDRLDPATDHRAQAQRLGFGVKAHHPGHGIGVRDPQCVVAKRPGGGGKIHRVRSTA